MNSPLSDDQKAALQRAAHDASARAHCPYSQFHVGAALLSDGEIITGCNVENASYGLTICAERVAIGRAVAMGKTRIQALAVTCVDAPPEAPISSRMPCGACRQVIAEFADLSIPILVEGAGEFTLGELLPHAFQLQRDEPR